jgi:hypothetical protein
MYSKRTFLAVAAVIALGAFATGQAVPGLGVLFLVPASTLWVVWCARNQGKLGRTDR